MGNHKSKNLTQTKSDHSDVCSHENEYNELQKTNYKELIVFGFIRQTINPLISANIIIPTSILKLCYLFYHQFQLFMFFIHFNQSNNTHQLHIIEPNDKYHHRKLNILSIGKTYKYSELLYLINLIVVTECILIQKIPFYINCLLDT